MARISLTLFNKILINRTFLFNILMINLMEYICMGMMKNPEEG